VPKLAADLLDTEHCPGARGLSEAEIATMATPSPTPAEAERKRIGIRIRIIIGISISIRVAPVGVTVATTVIATAIIATTVIAATVIAMTVIMATVIADIGYLVRRRCCFHCGRIRQNRHSPRRACAGYRDRTSNEYAASAECHHILHRLGAHGSSFSLARPSRYP
jgi:hypothetical protein